MHNYPPPKEALELWLKAYGTVEDENYGHLLLEQLGESDAALLDALRPYFESAHLDAREYFHKKIGVSLHPDAKLRKTVTYPNCLPSKALRGLFGEVIAGLVTEAYQEEFVGGHPWQVPIFLFREHDDVEKYLWSLRYDEKRAREIYGRHGTDFVGISLDDAGEVVRVIAGEAKWRKSLTPSAVGSLLHGPKIKDEKTGKSDYSNKGIWYEVNRDSHIPHGLRQMQFLLELRDPIGHASTILSIDKAVLNLGPAPERTDLIVISGNEAARRSTGETIIPWEETPKEYKAGRDLQIVEVILKDGNTLIDKLYESLWSDE
ncbi:aminotransferase [Pseudomonas sichuanensis]|uniref:Aminotransferase n=1 Tax=Pseudomonas sichuanensis TaxID=2213015 RepID=A0ABV0DFE1_9PSED